MSLKTVWRQFLDRVNGNRKPRPRPRGTRLRLEELEPRVLLATDLGTLVGRQYITGHVFETGSDSYTFALKDAAFLDAQIVNNSDPLTSTSASVLIEGPSVTEGAVDLFGQEGGELHIPVPAGTSSWGATVRAPGSFAVGTNYTLALAADAAPGRFSSSGGSDIDFRGNVGLDLGTLSTVGTRTLHDFVGSLDSALHFGHDLVDTYFFDTPVFGTVTMTLDQLEHDPSGGDVFPNLILFRDVNGDGHLPAIIGSDGHFQAGEVLDDKIAGVNQSGVISRQLNAGHYVLIVTQRAGATFGLLSHKSGGSNYRLRLNYAVADNAGTALTQARDIGAVGNAPRSFADYLSSGDTTDTYKFSISGGGPFVLSAGLSNMPADANFDVDIIQDKNGNGNVDDASEVLAQSANPFANEDISAGTPSTGTYFVRVRRIDGEGPYTVTISSRNTDLGGNTLDTATPFNADINPRKVFTDFVSFFDSADIYKFTTTTAAAFAASFGATPLDTDADLQLIDDTGEILAASAKRSRTGEAITRALAAGTYFVRVERIAGSSAFPVTLTITLDTAGNTLASARTMGLTGDTFEYIGPDDTADFYKIPIVSPIQLNVFTGGLTLTVGRDANRNNVVDPGETMLARTIGPSDDQRTSLNLVNAGTYFVAVTQTVPASAIYGIVFATAPIDSAGNDPETAKDLGVLGATRTFNDFVGDGSRDATDDVDDYYRFTLADNGPFNFSAQFNIPIISATLDYQLFRDGNQNQKFDDGEEVLFGQVTTLPITAVLDKPGTYYFRVLRPAPVTSGGAEYTLTLSAASTDNGANTLGAAEFFGALTSTPATLHEFVGAIDRDDFYFISVAGPGMLSGTLNTNQAGIDVEVIQDPNSNGAVDVGETLFNSNNGALTTIFGSLNFQASLPAAGKYFVHVLSGGLDAPYDLSLRFSTTVGFFVMNPRESTINAGDHVKLALDWTVPTGSWHSLQDVQLRLRDTAGALALINFHEADNTVSLFDPNTGKYGPAKVIGSDAVLANRDVKIFLKTSSVRAAGPSSPIVTLTFDIVLNGRDFDQRILIEAAASDDLGQVQDFAFAGTLIVLRRRRIV